MLKALGIFVRLLSSLLVLLVVALYLQTGIDNISPEQFAASVTPESITVLFTSFNWVSITAGVLVLLALLRLLDMAWNVAFCLSFIPVLFCGLYAYFGETAALPAPLQGNAYMTEFCTLPQTYPVAAIIVIGVFALGWMAATAAFRIAVSTLVSFGLWYGMSALLYFVITTRWADTPEPAQPEILTMVLANPWMIAALPGAFFLVYAVLVSFFETFLTKKKPAAKKDEKKDEKKDDKAPDDTAKKEDTAKTAASLKPATPAQPKVTVKKPAPAPAEPKKDEAPKAEEKSAEPKKDEAPKAEEKSAEPKKDEAPKAEEKSAEPKKDEAPKAEEKPAEPKKD